jgi:Ca2+-binding EF-hand superfamily protein
MEIADIDGSGTIDQAEFVEFMDKLDNEMEESKAIEIFQASDAEGNGELPIESFATALYEGLKLMKQDEGEEQE